MKTYAAAEEIRLIYSGNNYFDVLLKMIDAARETLHLQTYIFAMDHTGTLVMDALKNAAGRGVRVFLLVDAYASFPFPQDVADELRTAGVHFRLFSPLLSSESVFIGRRLHHKVAVADRICGIVGGINIADKYNSNVSTEAWLDYAVYVRGEVCEYLHLLCERFYLRRPSMRLAGWEKGHFPFPGPDTSAFIRFRRNDWIRGRNEIHKSYLEGLIRAESTITLVAAYFLPGNTIRRLLRRAAERGVDIRVIVAGQSDIPSLRLAEQYLYNFYLRHGIKVYEWRDSVLHGKVMLVDNTWCTIGSYNLNFLSHYISIELNADVICAEFIGHFSTHLNSIVSESCNPVQHLDGRYKSNVLTKILSWIAYNFYRMLMGAAGHGRRHRLIEKRKRRF
jgi:cardiolipin synthase A/B